MLSAPSSQDLQHAAGQFAASGKLRGGRSAPPNLRPWLLIENLHRVKKFNYPEVFFPSRETIQHEKDKQTGLAAAVIWSLHNSTVLTKELSQSSQLIGPSTLQPSPKLRVVNKRTPSVDISFLQRAVGSLVLPPCSSPGPPETRRPGEELCHHDTEFCLKVYPTLCTFESKSTWSFTAASLVDLMALLFATPVVLHRERVANPPQSTSIDSPWTF